MKKTVTHTDNLLELLPKQQFQIRAKITQKMYNHFTNWDSFPWDTHEIRSQDPRKIFMESTGQWHLKRFGGAFVGGRKIAGQFYSGTKPGSNTLGAFYSDKIEVRFSNPKTATEKARVTQSFKGQRVFDYAEFVLPRDMIAETGFNLDAAVTEALEEWLNLQ